jgi:hypothetical protein
MATKTLSSMYRESAEKTLDGGRVFDFVNFVSSKMGFLRFYGAGRCEYLGWAGLYLGFFI